MSLVGLIKRCIGFPRRRMQYNIVKKSPMWDAEWYSRVYGIHGKTRALKHFCTAGWKQGLDPSPYFSTQSYLEKNPDINAAGINPVIHYEQNGKFEFRPFDCSSQANR